MSNVIAAGGGGGGTASATSAEVATLVQTASAAATSVDGRVTSAAAALAAAVNVVSNALSNELSVRAASVQTASAAATSVLTYVCAVSARTTGDASVKGLQSVVNGLSARISAIVAGAASVTSAEHNTLSQAVSVLQEMDRRRVVTDAQTIAGALTNVSGMCVAVSAGGTFNMDAVLLVDRPSIVMSGPTRFGMTFPTMTKTRGELHVVTTALASAALALPQLDAVWDGNSASGSILASVTVSSGAINMYVRYHGVFVVAADGNIVLQAGASAGITNGIAIQQGSYMHVFRLA